MEQELLNKLVYCLDGRRSALAANNRGEADEWQRHIDAAYLNYADFCAAKAEVVRKLPKCRNRSGGAQ